MLKKLSKILLATAALAAILPAVSSAQIGSNLNINFSYSLPSELNVDINPQYPAPGQKVSVSLAMYTEDLNSATITWYQDGQNVLSGKGETKYSFTAGSAGKSTSIEIYIRLLSGTIFSKTITIKPASVDLIWESDSYVPPFYRGKALHPAQGNLKIVALPHIFRNGSEIPASSLVYTWSNGTETYQSQSGYGKNVLMMQGSLLGRSEDIKVVVSDPISNISALGLATINPADPKIIFYENNPYYGPLFDSAITNFNLSSGEVQILAAPYYFTQKNSLLTFNWTLNGQSLPDLSNSRTAVFRKPEGQSGSSSIYLSVANNQKILQQADGGLRIVFENNNQNNGI